MIELYTWSTPNGRKVSIMLEECGLPYRVFPIDITEDAQFAADFLKISPNNKIPAIIDPDGPGGEPVSVFESGAILIYLTEKTGKFLPDAPMARMQALEWLMWQMGGFGPMLGQAHHFMRFSAEQVPYAITRYGNEAKRLYGVLNERLANRDYVAGAYSIADMAIFPWAMRHEWHGIDLAEFAHVKRWAETIGSRKAVVAGMAVPAPKI